MAARPAIPAALRARVHVRTAANAAARGRRSARRGDPRPRAGRLRAPRASRRRRLGCAIADPPGLADQPELAAAAVLRLAESDVVETAPRRADAGELRRGRRGPRAALRRGADASAGTRRDSGDPLADRDWIVADLHMHTSQSHDCSTPVADLLDHAEADGLGAIAVTDHNVFGGARRGRRARARRRRLIVIPGEEVKTDGQGEVIGLFLREEIPRGMSFADTIAAIREQDGVVYVPHPFDRLHAIPSPETLHRHLPDIDVFEVYNARLLFESLQRRGAALRAQVRAARGRRLRRPRAPGRRHGRRADARASTARRSSCSRCAPPRCSAGRSRSRTSSRSSGSPRSRRRSARDEVCRAPHARR